MSFYFFMKGMLSGRVYLVGHGCTKAVLTAAEACCSQWGRALLMAGVARAAGWRSRADQATVTLLYTVRLGCSLKAPSTNTYCWGGGLLRGVRKIFLKTIQGHSNVMKNVVT